MRPEPPDFVNRMTGHVIDGEGCPSVPGPTHVTEERLFDFFDFGGGYKRQRPFDCKKVLYLIGLKYTISFLFGQNQELTQDLLIEKHG